MPGLLSDTADWVKSKQIRIERWAKDGNGRIGFRCTIEDQRFWVVARKYMPSGNIGFMQRIVDRAVDQDALILVRIGSPDIEKMLVFRPDAIKEHGDPLTVNDNRQRRGETWLNIDPDMGCTLEDYTDGWDRPKKNPGEVAGPEGSSLADY